MAPLIASAAAQTQLLQSASRLLGPSLAVHEASDSGRSVAQFDLGRLSCSMLTNWPAASASRREHRPLICLVLARGAVNSGQGPLWLY